MKSVRMVDPATHVDSLWHRCASLQAAARVAPAARAAPSSSAVLDGSRDFCLEHGETRTSRRLYPLGGSFHLDLEQRAYSGHPYMCKVAL